MRAVRRGERGSVTVFGALLAITVFLGMLAATFDFGKILSFRRRMVNAADAASLAAAQSCALKEGEAVAVSQADQHATENRQGIWRDTIAFSPSCEPMQLGEVETIYKLNTTFDVAAFFGLDGVKTVGARAVAIWGAAGGSHNVAPIELSIDALGNINCVVEETEKETCGYWHDNSANDFDSSSNWGTIDLSNWDVPADANCPGSASQSDLRDWMVSSGYLELADPGPTYACTDSGFGKEFWMNELQKHLDKPFDFPVNDPSRTILTSGKSKYAIIGFVRMKLVAVYEGKDPGVLATPARSGTCTITRDVAKGTQLDLNAEALECTGGEPVDAVSAPTSVKKGNQSYTSPADYSFAYSPTGPDLTWNRNGAVRGVRITFNWSIEAKEGICQSADETNPANAICLVLEYPGLRIGGSIPGGGTYFPGSLQAIQLKE